MVLTFTGTRIQRISIIDDDKDARNAYAFTIEDLDLTPILEETVPQDVTQLVSDLSNRVDAVFCDYHLRKRNYAAYDGDLVVAECYRRQIPAILCTQYTDFDVTLLRNCRRYIPALLRSHPVDLDLIAEGWERCVEEFQGKFRPDRRPWRALVRVDEVVPDQPYFYVIVPSWSPHNRIRLMFVDLDPLLHPLLIEGKRFHAQVNTGAQSLEELYFHSWEEK